MALIFDKELFGCIGGNPGAARMFNKDHDNKGVLVFVDEMPYKPAMFQKLVSQLSFFQRAGLGGTGFSVNGDILELLETLTGALAHHFFHRFS